MASAILKKNLNHTDPKLTQLQRGGAEAGLQPPDKHLPHSGLQLHLLVMPLTMLYQYRVIKKITYVQCEIKYSNHNHYKSQTVSMFISDVKI